MLPILVVACLLAATAAAQISGGVFRGEVRDASQALVPQAKILIRSNDTGVEIFAESNNDGLYLTPTLIPGSYTLSTTKTGIQIRGIRSGPSSSQPNRARGLCT